MLPGSFFAVAVVVSIVTILGGLFGIYKSRTIRSDKRFYTAAVSLVIALLCLLLVIIFYASMEALQQSQPLCITSNLVSILSAIACVICLTVLIGIMYMATNRIRKSIFELPKSNKESYSEHDKLPKLTGAKLGKSFRDSEASGKCPSIAVNNHSLVVMVFMYDGWWKKKQLKYRIGQLSGSGIKWRGNEPCDYSTGQRPRIAINSNNMVVAVHENSSRDRCVYRVGSVGQETIEWGKETEFVKGCCPDVAITDSKAILTFITTSGHRHYFAGSINSETKTIDLREDKDAKNFPNKNATQLSIAVNNGGRVVAAYFTGGSICCMVGALKEDGEIKWQSEGPQNLVRSTADPPPVVSINSQGYVVVVLSLKLSYELYCFVGRTFDNSTSVEFVCTEGSVKKYDNGYYPAASIDDENNIVEIHEAIWTTRLFYHVGKLLLETPV